MPKHPGRLTLQLAVAMMSGVVLPIADAADYPEKPIRFIMPFSPGGGGDITARLVARYLGDELGQSVIVDNRPGAGGIIGWDLLAESSPDGYTIGHASSGLTSVGNFAKLPFDPVKSFSGVSLVSLGTNVLLTHPSVEVRSVKDLIAAAKAKPDALNCATAGAGSPMHLASLLFNRMAETRIVDVPYKGGAPALTALLGKEVDLMFGALVQTLPVVKGGKLRALAVTTAQRSAVLPQVPTLAEAGVPGYEFNAWIGVVTPRGTPPEIVARLNQGMLRVMKRQEVQAQLAAAGPMSSSPAELDARIAREVARWRELLSR